MATLPNEVGSAVFAMADFVHLLDHDTRSDAPQFGEPVGTRTTRLTDTIFGWASLQLVHFSCKDEVL
jgi:hypothetical protein